jgi:hypothetical protein
VDVYLSKLQAKAAVYTSSRQASQAVVQYAQSYGADASAVAGGASGDAARDSAVCEHWARAQCWVTDCMHSHPEGQGSMHPNTSLHRLRVTKSTKGRGRMRTDEHKALKAELKTVKAQMAALKPGSSSIRSDNPNHIVNNTPVCQSRSRRSRLQRGGQQKDGGNARHFCEMTVTFLVSVSGRNE